MRKERNKKWNKLLDPDYEEQEEFPDTAGSMIMYNEKITNIYHLWLELTYLWHRCLFWQPESNMTKLQKWLHKRK